MDNQEFIRKFADAIEIEDKSKLSSETKFRELEEWNSLASLSLISFLDEEYEVQIETRDMINLTTLGDIINFINNNN